MAGPHGILNGTEIKVYAGSHLILYGTSATLNVSMTTRETTGLLTQGWESCMEGTRSWSIDADGMYAWETDGGAGLKNADYLFKSIMNLRQRIYINFGTTDMEDGDVKYSGWTYLTSISLTGGTEDSATYSASFKGNGELTLTEY